LAGADNFGLEKGKADQAIEWMNGYAKKNNLKFEAKLAGQSMETVKFGAFQLYSWTGDWSSARNIVKKASGKLGIKTIEAGFHQKQGLLSAMLGGSAEYAKVYSSGKLVGKLVMEKKSGSWLPKSEAFA
jgi:hypothetical protein